MIYGPNFHKINTTTNYFGEKQYRNEFHTKRTKNKSKYLVSFESIFFVNNQSLLFCIEKTKDCIVFLCVVLTFIIKKL